MRLFLATALGLAAAAPLARAAAQNTIVDEGTLIVVRNGAVVGRETFRIVEVDGGEKVFTATAQVSHGTRRLTPALSVSATGNPLLYRMELREGTTVQERLQATARPGRLSVLLQTDGGEAAKDYVLGSGALVLDDDIYHHYAFVPAARAGGAGSEVMVVVPRSGRQLRATLAAVGEEQVEIGGRTVPATHYVLTLPGGARDVWADANGRLLRVSLPALALTATREELPR